MQIESKVVIGEGNEAKSYPWIGAYFENDNVAPTQLVMFIGKNTGIVLMDNSDFNSEPVGNYRKDWYESNFLPYYGKVTLQMNH